MFAIIEAGGTKTEVRFLDGQKEVVVSGPGINPYIHTDEQINNRLKEMTLAVEHHAKNWERVFYYGAGCSHPAQVQRIQNLFLNVLPKATVEIQSDMLGAARALCGHKPGFAVILGTGSNACLFDGAAIKKGMTSFGFWLGDEGSGGHIGKLVFRSWLKGELSEFNLALQEHFGSPASLALEALYNDPSPNSRVASLAEIAIKNSAHPLFKKHIESSIRSFFDENLDLWEGNAELPWHFTGSVAWNLRELLTSFLESNQKVVGTFLPGPSQKLFQFHLQSYLACKTD